MATTEYINSTNFKNWTKFYQENNLTLDDDIILVQDISAEDKPKMKRLESLSEKLYPTEAEKTEITQLMVELISYMPTANVINGLNARLYGMQVYLKEGVVIFFNQQKQEIIDIMNNHKYMGIFSPLTAYKQGNMVMFDGYGFISKVDDNLGNIPDKEAIDDGYWIRFTIKGDKGDPSLNISIKKGTDGISSDYDPLQTYNVGDACVYNHRLYYCLVDGIIGILVTDITKWACAEKIWVGTDTPLDTSVVWWDTNIGVNTVKRYSDNNVWVTSTLDGKTAIGVLLTNEKINLVNAINELKNNINTLETGITNLTNNKIDKTDFVSKNTYCGLTSGNGSNYISSANPTLNAYVDGMNITIVPHVDCLANPTLNIDGKGALPIKNGNTNLLAGDMKANTPVSLVRVGSSFFIRSSTKTDIFDKLYTKNPWQYFGTSMPTARFGLTSQLYKGKIYCIGGQNYNSTFNKVEIYDISTNSWSIGAVMPTPRSYLASAIFNGKIYCFGGYTRYNSGMTATLEIYDIESNTWYRGTDYNTPYVYSASEIYNDTIYFLGGEVLYAQEYASEHIITYNITNNTWTDITTGSFRLPKGGGRVYSILVNDNIYFQIQGEIYLFNISTKTISFLNYCANGTNSVYYDNIYYNGKMYSFGGAFYGFVEIYNISTNMANIESRRIPTERSDLSATLYNDKVYCIGGMGAGNINISNTVEIYNLK